MNHDIDLIFLLVRKKFASEMWVAYGKQQLWRFIYSKSWMEKERILDQTNKSMNFEWNNQYQLVFSQENSFWGLLMSFQL